MIGRTPHWVWRNPAQSSQWVARAAALLLALPCILNILLVKVSRDKDIFEWWISVSAGIAAIILIARCVYGSQHVLFEYGALLATGMWAANAMEIALSRNVTLYGQLRNGGFYLSFAMLSGLFYLADRVGHYTDDAPVNKAVEIVDHLVEHSDLETVAAAASDIDAHRVADVVVEEHVGDGLP